MTAVIYNICDKHIESGNMRESTCAYIRIRKYNIPNTVYISTLLSTDAI